VTHDDDETPFGPILPRSAEPTPNPRTDVLDVLPPHEQDNWQEMEYWSYANDGEDSSPLWDDGEFGPSPKFLGVTIEQ
jgi:hypothetical protein